MFWTEEAANPARAQGTSPAQMLIHLFSHLRERPNIQQRCGLFVLLYEIPVRVHLE